MWNHSNTISEDGCAWTWYGFAFVGSFFVYSVEVSGASEERQRSRSRRKFLETWHFLPPPWGDEPMGWVGANYATSDVPGFWKQQQCENVWPQLLGKKKCKCRWRHKSVFFCAHWPPAPQRTAMCLYFAKILAALTGSNLGTHKKNKIEFLVLAPKKGCRKAFKDLLDPMTKILHDAVSIGHYEIY